MDRKFVLNGPVLDTFLSQLEGHYFLVLSEGHRWARYENVYFDTPELQLFDDHFRGRRPRHKVRIRHHLDRGQSFVEVKSKDAGGRTKKFQLRRDSTEVLFGREESLFLASHLPPSLQDLKPSLQTNFRRATLLSASTQERITLDLALSFAHAARQVEKGDLCLVELKQAHCSHATLASRVLHDLKIYERSLSKYCTGVALLHANAQARYRSRYLKQLARLAK